MTAPFYTGLNNTRYSPGRKVGQGGEGTVYEVREDAGLVIKVYNEVLGADKADKLTYMASIANPELNKFAAWPLDVIVDGSMRVWGFTMRKLVAHVPLHMLFSPMERKKVFADKGYSFLVHVSRNLATAFYKIHELDIIAGDVNEANILVNPNGMVALIDCDSFQVKNGKRYHFCEVGIPRYTPPELLERGSFTNVVRTVNTDAFSLATLIFQLLFLGRAPFTGINQGKEEIDEEKAIRTKEFAYSLTRNNKKLLPAKSSLPLKFFPMGIIKLFHAAFEEVNKRPQPKDWIIELDNLSRQIVTCNNFKIHQYPKGMQECPWCRFKEKEGVIFFLDDTFLAPAPMLSDIDRFVNGFKLPKLEIKKLSENYATGNLMSVPINSNFYNLKKINKIITGVIVLLTIVACFLFGPTCIVPGLVLVLLANTIFPAQSKLKRELAIRQKNFDSLKAKFQTIIKQHNNPPDITKYNKSATRLTALINGFKNLPSELAIQKKRIEEKHYNAKYKFYLFQFDILKHHIPAFGAAKKQLLYDNGIRNAADINKLNNIKISGIGAKNTQLLFDWQRQVGAGFAYMPDQTLITNDINVATGQLTQKKQLLETDIKTELQNLQVLNANIQANVKTIERQYADIARKLYQSELDLNAFKSLMKKI